MNGSVKCEVIEDASLIDPEPETATESAAVTKVWHPGDPGPAQTMRLMETSGALEFWNHPDEDIYGPEDGEPV